MSVNIDISADFTGWDWNADYNQKLTAAQVNGRWLRGFMDGTPLRITHNAGGVAVTEGADGPGLNRATPQGVTIEIDLREDSPDHNYLADLIRNQVAGGPSVMLVVYTGTQRSFEGLAQISTPGDLATGGPQMGSQTYTFVSKKSYLY